MHYEIQIKQATQPGSTHPIKWLSPNNTCHISQIPTGPLFKAGQLPTGVGLE